MVALPTRARQIAGMQLDLRGHPLHSRALSVALLQRADGKLDVEAMLFDLRKRGFVPVGGDLGSPGLVHHMALRGVVEPRGPVLESIAAEQKAVAFEPSALTRGESCRDPIARVAGISGVRLDGDFAKHLSAALGGPRGCSHILTLGQLLGSSVAWALGPGGARGIDPERVPGARVFRRDVIVDGHERAPGKLELGAQLTDLYFATAPPIAHPMARFAAQHEVRVWAEVDLMNVAFGALRAAERRRDRSNLESAPWRDLSDRVVCVSGVSLFKGVSAEILARLGADAAHRPLLDALLMFAPAFIQVCGTLSEGWPTRALGTDTLVGIGGIPDSCYMWRREGALHEARKPTDPDPMPDI